MKEQADVPGKLSDVPGDGRLKGTFQYFGCTTRHKEKTH